MTEIHNRSFFLHQNLSETDRWGRAKFEKDWRQRTMQSVDTIYPELDGILIFFSQSP